MPVRVRSGARALDARILEELVALRAGQGELQQSMARLEALLTAPIDGTDAEFFTALQTWAGDRTFTAAAVVAAAKRPQEQRLRDALEAGRLSTAKELTWFLKRLAGRPFAAGMLTRVGESRNGIRYRCGGGIRAIVVTDPA